MVNTARTYSKEEYLNLIQLEYFSFLLRTKIYVEPFAKIARDITERKQQRIKTLKEERPSLKCIFDSDSDLEMFFRDKFLNKRGLPNLRYSPKNELHQSTHDVQYLFKKVKEVEYCGVMYNVLGLNGFDSLKLSKDDGKVVTVKISEVFINFSEIFGI